MKTTRNQRPGCGSRHALLHAGFTLDEIFDLTKIDRWFLAQMKEIVDFEEELADIAAYDAAKPRVMAEVKPGRCTTLPEYRASRAQTRR